jgi:hypothetical protein
MDLWAVTKRYGAFGLMENINAIVPSSKPPEWGSEKMLTDLVSIIRQFAPRFMLQANLFLQRLLQACRGRIMHREVDDLMAMMPVFFNEDEEKLEGWTESERRAFRYIIYFRATGSTLP